MVMRLLSNSLFNPADKVFTFPAFFSALPSAARLGLRVSSPAFCLIAHVILIDVQRLTPDFRTVLVALLSNLRLIVLLGLIAHIILIHVQRLTPDFRTALVALLSNLRLIV
jgi:hypothetical protein